MSKYEKDSLPPSYTASMALQTPQPSPRGQSLLPQLSQARTTHILSVISTHIIPLVEQQASFGIAQTTIAMLPSDIPLPAVEERSEFSFDTADSKLVTVIGFASEDEPKVVRLEGQMNRIQFWRTQAVIVELERLLGYLLNESEHLRSPSSPSHRGTSEFQQHTAVQPRRTFLDRIMPLLGPEEQSRSSNTERGIGQVESHAGLVLVKARLEDICLRTVTDFGLYDTMNKQCVIIRVDARC